jgi:hypothetical protein
LKLIVKTSRVIAARALHAGAARSSQSEPIDTDADRENDKSGGSVISAMVMGVDSHPARIASIGVDRGALGSMEPALVFPPNCDTLTA